jgi:SPOR domain
MTDYYPLIARAVEEPGRSTGEARQSLYERARNAVAQLRSNPALLEADIAKECLALEEAIRKVEAEAAPNSSRETCAEPRSAAPSEGITDGDRIQSADHGQSASPERDDRPQPLSSRRVPAFLASASDDPDNADIQAVAIGRAYGADHYYDDVPGSRWRGGSLVLMAVLALAVLAGIFAYRGTFGGHTFPALPPILKAGTGPNNIVQNNSDKKYVTSAGSSEKLQPIDTRGAPKPVPRVISTIPISSKPRAGAVAPAPTASTPGLVPAMASDLDPQVAASAASALMPVPTTSEPKDAGAIALATREQVPSMPDPAPPLLTGELPPPASAPVPVPASSEPRETAVAALAEREQVPSMPDPAPPVLTGEHPPPASALMPVPTTSEPKDAGAIALATREQVPSMPDPAPPVLTGELPPRASAPVPVPASSEPRETAVAALAEREQVPSMPDPAPPVLTGVHPPPASAPVPIPASSEPSQTAVAASVASTPALGPPVLTAPSVPPFGSAPVLVPTSSDSKKIQSVNVGPDGWGETDTSSPPATTPNTAIPAAAKPNAAAAPLVGNHNAREDTPPSPSPASPRQAGETAAEVSSRGGYAVQVASVRSAAEAHASFRMLRAKFLNQLGGREPIVRRANLVAKGTYYRVMVGPFGSMERAAGMCGTLKAAGCKCLVQRI